MREKNNRILKLILQDKNQLTDGILKGGDT